DDVLDVLDPVAGGDQQRVHGVDDDDVGDPEGDHGAPAVRGDHAGAVDDDDLVARAEDAHPRVVAGLGQLGGQRGEVADVVPGEVGRDHPDQPLGGGRLGDRVVDRDALQPGPEPGQPTGIGRDLP